MPHTFSSRTDPVLIVSNKKMFSGAKASGHGILILARDVRSVREPLQACIKHLRLEVSSICQRGTLVVRPARMYSPVPVTVGGL